MRKIGDFYEIDFHLQVAPELSVEQGHEIARAVKRLQQQHPEVWCLSIEPARPEHLQARGISDGLPSKIR